tara:strand:- start:207 stop:1052 length:846 start_codon:yes stop_codon:yes gene_type:complete
MSAQKKGLGKGLSALFGDIKTKKDNNNIQKNIVAISDLQRNKYQPRTFFDEAKLEELSMSIKENGIVQPIAVRVNKFEVGKFEIVAGERRWLAAQKAGLNKVPVVVLDIDDQKTLEIAIIENVQREDLNIIDEAKGYQRLNQEFGYDHEKISKLMSKSRSHVSNTLRLLNLPADVVGLLEESKLTAGQARPLIGLPNASEIAENIVAKKVAARQVEVLVKKKKGRNFEKFEDPNISFVKNEIESKLGLNVEISNKKNNSGKIIIKYKTLEQFELISKLLRQ